MSRLVMGMQRKGAGFQTKWFSHRGSFHLGKVSYVSTRRFPECQLHWPAYDKHWGQPLTWQTLIMTSTDDNKRWLQPLTWQALIMTSTDDNKRWLQPLTWQTLIMTSTDDSKRWLQPLTWQALTVTKTGDDKRWFNKHQLVTNTDDVKPEKH